MARIAVIGCGLVGRAWAIVFARAGHEIALYDSAGGAVDRALATIDAGLKDLERAGLIVSAAATRDRIGPSASLAEALESAIYAQESVPENRDTKAAVFAEMDRWAPQDAVLGSSCSAIPGSQFLSGIAGRARCLIAHPANPPHLMPIVELVPTPWTSPETVERCRALMGGVGQIPVVVKKEVPGFVMNRLQAGLVNEAMQLVSQGVMSADDIDKVVRYSLGLRWSFMGPFETMDLNAPQGFRDYAMRYGPSFAALGRDLRAAAWDEAAIDAVETDRRAKIEVDQLPRRQAWRDRRLMALLKHIAQSDRDFGT